MIDGAARTRITATRLLRGIVLAVVATSTALPTSVRAAPAPTSEPDLAAFDQGFRAGQEQFNRKEYPVAARTWTRAADLLPETAEHKDNRRAIHEYIAEAYEKAAGPTGHEDLVREGLKALDAYAEGFTAAYPQEALPEPVVRVRTAFRERLAEGEAARQRVLEDRREAAPQPAPPPQVPPPAPLQKPDKPWKGLAIGGGVAVAGGAGMLAMFAAGAARARSSTAAFDDPTNMCDRADPTGKCADIDGQGRRANTIAVAGLVAAPLLLGAGITMLVIARKRKSANTALVPMLGPGTAALVWQQRF